MSKSQVEVMYHTTSDIYADGVEDEFCQLHIGHM